MLLLHNTHHFNRQLTSSQNSNIGKNLHLHPVVNVAATWVKVVKPWEGTCTYHTSNQANNANRGS
jgi:hypothetical protein